MIDGKKVKRLRTDLNLSQSAIAERSDISQTQLSRIESELGDTTTSIASAVARALGVELSEILIPSETSENPTKPRPKKERSAPGRKARSPSQRMAS